MSPDLHIPDTAYAAAESAVDAAHICDNSGCCFRDLFSDVAVDAAAPLIVADYLERLADGGWSPDRYTAAGQLIPRAALLARAAELRGGAR